MLTIETVRAGLSAEAITIARQSGNAVEATVPVAEGEPRDGGMNATALMAAYGIDEPDVPSG